MVVNTKLLIALEHDEKLGNIKIQHASAIAGLKFLANGEVIGRNDFNSF